MLVPKIIVCPADMKLTLAPESDTDNLEEVDWKIVKIYDPEALETALVKTAQKMIEKGANDIMAYVIDLNWIEEESQLLASQFFINSQYPLFKFKGIPVFLTKSVSTGLQIWKGVLAIPKV